MTSLGEKQETKKLLLRFLQTLRRARKDFLKDIGHSSEQELKKSGLWNHAAEMMMINLRERKHPTYSEERVRWPEDLYNGESTTAELLFRIMISVNQLSVYGAASDWCEEFAQQIFRSSFNQYREYLLRN